MNKHRKQISLLAFFVILIGVRTGAQTSDSPEECSEKARQLLKKAWEAQPMNARGNKADPAKAESLYKEAIKDYTQALEIRMKLLKVEGFNSNGAVFYDIAGTYSLMNKLDESLEYLKLALSIDKAWGNKNNAQVNSDLKNVRKDSRFWILVNQK